MSGGEPSSIKRNVSCAAASLHTYVPDIFYFSGWCAIAMRENYNRRLPSLWDRFSAFIVRVIPWVAAHVFLGLCIGSLYAIERYGAENAEAYYFPPLVGAFIAALIGFWAYY